MHEHREVRVTARQSVRQDFIAPDLSPVQRHLQIDQIGIQGWTDFDVKIPQENRDGLAEGHADRELADMKVGTVIRKVSARREVSRKRPSVRRWA